MKRILGYILTLLIIVSLLSMVYYDIFSHAVAGEQVVHELIHYIIHIIVCLCFCTLFHEPAHRFVDWLKSLIKGK